MGELKANLTFTTTNNPVFNDIRLLYKLGCLMSLDDFHSIFCGPKTVMSPDGNKTVSMYGIKTPINIDKVTFDKVMKIICGIDTN